MARMVVFYGSVRQKRQGIKAARFIVNHLEKRGHDVTLLDAKEIDPPLLDKMYKEYDKAPEWMERTHNTIDEAEGFVFVSGEYNHGIPPGLKNLIDHFQKEYHFKPAGICTYSAGPFGGVRAAVHMRAVLGELGMVTCSIMFPISKVQDFKEDGTPGDGAYERRVQRFLDELEWYVDALKPAREKGTPF